MKYLKQIISLVFLAVVSTMEAQIVVEAGNAESLLEAIDKANKQNIDSTASRLFVFIPNGVYDLGDRTLTQIWGHNIALVGESMEGVIIKNAPAVENEGISKTATLLNRGWNTYLQDLTLQNALDYYRCGPAGRAVCWQDKGNYTIFKRVRMLSYQDTYYSHSEECSHYMEDSEIHGTVDFICGAGDVYFNRCLIVTEKRNEDGTGKNARGWHTHPRCAWLNTTLETPGKLIPTRFEPQGIRSVDNEFFEYHTMDAEGNVITPSSNVVEFVVNDDCRYIETVFSEKEAKKYTIKNMFPKWRPDKKTRHLEKQIARIKKQYLKPAL